MSADDTDPAIVAGIASDVRRKITAVEGDYAPLILADFNDGLRRQNTERERLGWCNRHITTYAFLYQHKGLYDDR